MEISKNLAQHRCWPPFPRSSTDFWHFLCGKCIDDLKLFWTRHEKITYLFSYESEKGSIVDSFTLVRTKKNGRLICAVTVSQYHTNAVNRWPTTRATLFCYIFFGQKCQTTSYKTHSLTDCEEDSPEREKKKRKFSSVEFQTMK